MANPAVVRRLHSKRPLVGPSGHRSTTRAGPHHLGLQLVRQRDLCRPTRTGASHLLRGILVHFTAYAGRAAFARGLR